MSNARRVVACVAGGVVAAASAGAIGQCTVLVQDTFRTMPREHGGNGNIRAIDLGDSLSGFWALTPAGAQWRTPNQAEETWIFAGTGENAYQFDGVDPFNGCAFGYGHAAALVPVVIPAGQTVTYSAEVALGSGDTAPMFAGFTSGSALTDNFMGSGSLWFSMVGATGAWQLMNGGVEVASGDNLYGPLYSVAFSHIAVSYDPVAGVVWGSAGAQRFGPVAVTLARPLTYAGFEAHGGFFNLVDDLLVTAGTPVDVAVSAPVTVCGGSVVLSAAGVTDPAARVWWLAGYEELADGARPDGSVVTGSGTTALTIANAGTFAGVPVRVVVSTACGTAVSAEVVMGACGPVCGTSDFDGDGDVGTDADIEAFFACLGGNCCPTCGSSDFDGDGDVGTDADIEAFFRVLSGGSC